MTVWVECPNCGGKVEIPDAAPSDFPCPMCKYALLTSHPLERTRRLPSDSAPSWMRPWGYAFAIFGGLAFAAGIIEEYSASRNPPMVAVIVGGLLNPVFFIGFPLGIYWLRRSKKSHPLAAIASGKPGSTVPCEEQEQPLAVIDSGKPDSTVSCEEQEQPCRVDRFVWRFFVTFICVITCIFLGIVGGYWLTPMEELNKSSTGSSSHATSAQVGSQETDNGFRSFETVRESYERVRGLIAAQRYAEAMDACNKEIAVNPDDPYFYLSRAEIRRLTDDYFHWLSDLDLAISKIEARPPSTGLNQFRSTCLRCRAYCCFCLHLNDRAWADVNEVIGASPKDDWAFNTRGLVRQALGDDKGALDDYATAMKLAPRDTLYRANYERVARRLREAGPHN